MGSFLVCEVKAPTNNLNVYWYVVYEIMVYYCTTSWTMRVLSYLEPFAFRDFQVIVLTQWKSALSTHCMSIDLIRVFQLTNCSMVETHKFFDRTPWVPIRKLSLKKKRPFTCVFCDVDILWCCHTMRLWLILKWYEINSCKTSTETFKDFQKVGNEISISNVCKTNTSSRKHGK